MPSASVLRVKIEAALAGRIPSALTPAPRVIRPVLRAGIPSVDDLLKGGLPLGAITEITGPECSGRTSFALSFLAQITKEEKVCAWIDVSDAFSPESATASGVGVKQLLWVRCGVQAAGKTPTPPHRGFALPEKYLLPKPIKKGLHGGGFGPHPRGEVRGMSDAIGGFLHPETIAPRCAEPQRRVRSEREHFEPKPLQSLKRNDSPIVPGKPWTRIEQALRVTDLLLQAGGFSAIVLDMGGIAPEHVSRIPLATWFRYRAAAERTQAAILLLTQHASAKSSAGLVLRLHSENELQLETTVFTGVRYCVEVSRQRFAPDPTNVIPLRKPPQRANTANWQTRAPWAGSR